jgi:transcription antitermination factor NusG
MAGKKSDEMIDPDPAWYCVHTKPKCENSAASVLREMEGVETFCPRIRFQRSTRRGKVWFVEALFPSYFFARFSASEAFRAVKHSQNVIRVVEFGGIPVRVPDESIDYLRREMGAEALREIRVGIKVGDSVEVTEGPMRGLTGIVESVHSGEERVRILLEFLGRQSMVEISAGKLLSDSAPRSAVVAASFK